MKSRCSDHALAIEASGGDQEALAALVERFRLSLFATAYVALGHFEDAQDAVAAALVRICVHASEIKNPEQMRPWMLTIVRNEARRVYQKRLNAVSVLDAENIGPTTDNCAHIHLRIDVENALRRLPIDQCRAVALHYYLAGLPIREIAVRTSRPGGTVKSWLHFGRHTLADQMQEYAPMPKLTLDPRQIHHEPVAAILSTDLDTDALSTLTEALHGAGYPTIQYLDNYAEVAKLEYVGEGDSKELRLSAPLQGVDFLILDEWIGGRSAFELFTILRASKEREEMAACILLDGSDGKVSDASVLAAWSSGVELSLTKPVNPKEFERFARIVREDLERRRTTERVNSPSH